MALTGSIANSAGGSVAISLGSPDFSTAGKWIEEEAFLGAPENEWAISNAAGVDFAVIKDMGLRRQLLVLPVIYVAGDDTVMSLAKTDLESMAQSQMTLTLNSVPFTGFLLSREHSKIGLISHKTEFGTFWLAGVFGFEKR